MSSGHQRILHKTCGQGAIPSRWRSREVVAVHCVRLWSAASPIMCA
jgi:hypothetical protein